MRTSVANGANEISRNRNTLPLFHVFHHYVDSGVKLYAIRGVIQYKQLIITIVRQREFDNNNRRRNQDSLGL